MVNLELDTSEKVKLIQGEEFIVRKVKNFIEQILIGADCEKISGRLTL